MIETPGTYGDRPHGVDRYPADPLARYRYHTGAELRPIGPDEPCPILFRDVGPVALARFLRGGLRRLAGPYTPITYLRTAAYEEPYTDHEAIGRLVFLRPLCLHPWHSGVPSIYVARATRTGDPATIGFVPGGLSLSEVSRRVADVADVTGLRAVLGGRHHDAEIAESLGRLDRLVADLAETETRAEPLRLDLQSADPRRRERAVTAMARVGLDEADLCAAWHHLSRGRRAFIKEALRRLGGGG
jgi:hypothetical protein